MRYTPGRTDRAPAPLSVRLAEQLLDETTELVCAATPDGQITYVNRAWQRALGYTAAEAAAIRPVDLVAPEHRARYVETARRLVLGETVEAFEAVLVGRDGRRVVCFGRAVAEMVDTPDGPRCVGTRAVYRDVTAERAADDARARLLATFEATSDFVWTARPDGTVEYVNRAGRRMLGIADDADLTRLRTADFHAPATRALLEREGLPSALRDGTWTGEGAIRGAHGEEVPVSIAMAAHPSLVPGAPPYLSSVVRDLRERLCADAALRESEERFRAIFDHAAVGVSLIDSRGTVVDANAAFHAFLGYEPGELVGRHAPSLSPAEDAAVTRGPVAALRAGRVSEVTVEKRFVRRDGTLRWASLTLARMPLPGGEVGILGTTLDVTERRHAEDALRVSEAEHRALVDTLPLVVYRVSAEPPYAPLFVSAGVETLGFSHDEWMAHPDTWVRALHPDDRDRVLRETAAGLAVGRTVAYEYRLVAPDGSVRWVHDRGELVPGVDGRPAAWHGVMLDVSARRRAEAALRESEARHRTLFEHSTAVQCVVDPRTLRIADANEAAVRFYGYPLSRLRGMSLREIDVAPPDAPRDRVDASVDAVDHHGARMVVQQRVASGDVRTVEVHVTPVELDGGTFHHAIVYDLTERIAAERALRESEARVRGAVEASLDALLVLRAERDALGAVADFEIADCNARAARLWDMRRDGMVGGRFSEVFPAVHASRVFEAFRRVVDTGEPYVAEQETVDPRATVRWVKVQAVRVGDGVAVTLRDITDQKQVEETLRGLALLDELTGVHNRRGFMAVAEREWRRARREGRGAVLAYIDLDDFKSINDTYGHAEGDRALCTVADVLRAALRGADVIGRLGGDEFAVLVVPGGAAANTPADVAAVERRVRERLAYHLSAANAAASAAGRPYEIAMSVGTACAPGGADGADPAASLAASLAALMAEADQRLYDAKRRRSA